MSKLLARSISGDLEILRMGKVTYLIDVHDKRKYFICQYVEEISGAQGCWLELEDMIKHVYIIELSSSEWAAPIVLVKKNALGW